MPSIRCKLCQAFAASELPTAAERQLAGSDVFDRDADICNACLANNYAAKRPWIRFEIWAAMSLGSYLAVIVAVLIEKSRRGLSIARALSGPPAIRLMETFLIIMLAIIVPCWLVVWAILYLWWKLASRATRKSSVHEQQESKQVTAERLLWLAIWASITGHERFRLRMLRRVRKLGFIMDVEGRSMRPIAEPS